MNALMNDERTEKTSGPVRGFSVTLHSTASCCLEIMCRRGLNLPEITVRVNYPKSGGFNPLLFPFNRLLTPKHPQGELVDPWLKHGPKLPVDEPGLI